jgi:hypothetical protein
MRPVPAWNGCVEAKEERRRWIRIRDGACRATIERTLLQQLLKARNVLDLDGKRALTRRRDGEIRASRQDLTSLMLRRKKGQQLDRE